jgi:hypothetical protein
MIKIADLSFETAMARIWKDPSDDSDCWRISVSGVPSNILGEEWRPRFYWEDLRVPGVVASEGLPDREVRWGSVDIDKFEANPMLFVFEHLPVSEGHLRFGALTSTEIEISIVGLCDVYFGEYSTDLPFEVKANLRFE